MASSTLSNLTGQVRKTQTNSFAYSQLTDIWMGEWSTTHSTLPVAVKVIRGSICTNDQHFGVLNKKLLREAIVWSKLKHAHITPFYGICFDLGQQSAPCLIYPYFQNGDVRAYLQRNPNANRMKLVTQVADGMAYLHGHDIIHGDMKSTNILVDDCHNACITDFGISRILEVSGFTTGSVHGSYRWMALELLAYELEAYESHGHGLLEDSVPRTTTASDIWAFGMTVLEILTGQLPFWRLRGDSAIIMAIVRGHQPLKADYPDVGSCTWSKLEQCWDKDPDRRPSMDDLSQYFRNVPST